MNRLARKNIEDIFALTPVQEGMLFHYLKEPESDVYFEQLSLNLVGQINIEIFEQAWNFVLRTNEMLRSVFRWESVENPIQVVLKKHFLKPVYYDLSGKDRKKPGKSLRQIKARDRNERFRLQEVPFRVTLCKIEKNRYELILSNHHILYDGWSSGIILKELFDAYHALSIKKELVLPVKTKFKEFIKWIRHQDANKQEAFWKGYLEGFAAFPEFPVKIEKKGILTDPGIYHIRFGEERTRKIEAFVKKNKVTLAAFIYSAWGLLLQQYNNSRDVIFDTTVSVRPAKIKGIEDMVGLFINTLPLRVKTHGEENVLACLKRTCLHLQEREKYKAVSLAVINEYLEEARKYLLLDTLVVIENYPLDKILMQNKGVLTVDSYSAVGMTRYDLAVLFTVFDHIEARITYNQTLIEQEQVSALCKYFLLITDEILNQPGKKTHAIAPVLEEEKNTIIHHIYQRQTPGKNRPTGEYTAPGDPVEEKLAAIWSAVLRIDGSAVCVNRSFFDFGGHSLKAALLAANIHKELNVKMPLAEIFKSPTIKAMARYIKEADRDRFESIPCAGEKEYYVLSSAQKRLYFLQQMDENNTGYNMPFVLVCEGNLDVAKLENTFKQLIRRHESLRTSFQLMDEGPVQKIHKEVQLEIEYFGAHEIHEKHEKNHGIQIINFGGKEGEPAAALISSFIRPFDLSRAPLLRVGLIGPLHTSVSSVTSVAKRNLLMVDMHHIISDGSSMGIFLEEFIALYANEDSESGAGTALPGLRLQYKDYSEWQAREKQKEAMGRQEEFWLKQFETGVPQLELPVEFPRPGVQDFSGASQSFKINKEDTGELKKIAAGQGTTLYMVLLAIFNIFLAKISGQEDIVMGTPVAGRKHAELEPIIGMFVNSIALRNFPRGRISFARFLNQVKERTLAAFDNQDYQFEDLVERVVVKRDIRRHPLFDVAFSFQNMDSQSIALAIPGLEREITGLKLKPYQYENRVSKLDLNLVGFETGEELYLTLEYCTKLFKKETAALMIERFMALVKSVINDIHCEIQQLDCSTALEKELNKIEDIEFKL